MNAYRFILSITVGGLCILGCGGNRSSASDSGNSSSPGATATTTTQSSPGSADASPATPDDGAGSTDTIIFAGALATWTMPDGGSFDGLYDSILEKFNKCGSKGYNNVPKNQVAYTNNECQQVGRHIHMMEMKRLNGITTYSRLVDLDVQPANGTNRYNIVDKNNNVVKAVKLQPRQANHLNSIMNRENFR